MHAVSILKLTELMPYTIRIAHQQKSFIVEENETILDAATRQNFDIPHSCCEGICGSCEGQVIDGIVHYDETEHLVIDAEERAQGRALFCSAKACSDLLIDVPGMGVPAKQNIKSYTYTLQSLQLLKENIYQAFLLPIDKKITYFAGQYINVSLPGQESKPFSIANAPNHQGLLELHIRRQSDNLFAQQLIDHLQTHKTLTFEGPLGNCYYHPKPNMPSILLAVGTGFAPIKAILEEAFKNPSPHELSLFWAGKYPYDLYQMELAQQWEQTYKNFRFVPILASAETSLSWPGIYGNIIDIALDYYPNLAQHHIYFGGPIQLTMDGLEHFVANGAQTCYMYSDVFDFM
ncbi:MAG: NAD(P)H-flavin reductase [Gammaproteobacteria bacterium]|nr:NAD(P)H-flavin reductase [Gammaproteobacteria bacterium]